MIRSILISILFGMASLVSAEEIPAAELPKDTVKVVAVVYDYTVRETGKSIVEDGKVHPGLIKRFNKTLSDKDTAALLEALTEKHTETPRYVCDFAPHHGFIFYDKDGGIVGSVSVCFLCSELKSQNFPRLRSDALGGVYRDIRELIDGNLIAAESDRSEFHSYWDWKALAEIFRRNEIPIFSESEEYTDLRLE